MRGGRPCDPAFLVSVWVGIEAGTRSDFVSVCLPVALFGLSLTLTPRHCVTAWFAVGLVLGLSRSGSDFQPDATRPVTLSGRIDSNWRLAGDHYAAWLEVDTVRQGGVLRLWQQRVRVAVPGGLELAAVRNLRIRGYLRRAPPLANGPLPPGRPWTVWVKSPAFIEAGEGRQGQGLVESWIRRLRWRARERLEPCTSCISMPGVALARALILGDADDLPSVWRPCLARAGLAHILALSGLHVGLIAALIFLVTAILPVRARYLVVALGVLVYLAIGGARPSLVRATLMLLGGFGAHLLDRPRSSLHTLGCTAAAMLLISPRLSHDIGFVLTVSATAGILELAPRIERSLGWLPSPVRVPLSVSIAAQIATFPWVVSTFHFLSLSAPLWNILAMPWLCAFLVSSVVWSLTMVVAPGSSNLVDSLLEALVEPMQAMCALGADWFVVIPFGGALLPIVGWSVAVWMVLRRVRWRWLAYAAAICGAATLLPRSVMEPELVMLDVGQGEALLLRDGSRALLVDGGGWRQGDIARSVLLPALGSIGIHRLEGALLTHSDLDHCGGLVDLSRYIGLPRVWIGTGWDRSTCVDQLATIPGAKLVPLWSGRSLSVGRWHVRTLHPPPGFVGSDNARSLVLEASIRGRSVLLTGDIDARTESALMTSSTGLSRVEVLKIAHHGSKTSTSEDLLDGTRPALALISCGRGNRYGHPSHVVLERLRERGIPRLRTDLTGVVRVSFPQHGPLRIEMPGSPKSRIRPLRLSVGRQQRTR